MAAPTTGLTHRQSSFTRRDAVRAWCEQLPHGGDVHAIEALADEPGTRARRPSLPNVDARERRIDTAKRRELARADQLPELSDDALRIDWDLEERDGEHWTVLRHDGREIWRELAYYEGYERFAAIFELLRERYGSRLAEVRPTTASEVYLYGDKLSAPQMIARLNASLNAR